jgi:hypothetical protein
MKYFFLSAFFLLKYCFIKLFFKQKKIYTIEDLPSLHGIELQYLSNTICMEVYIGAANKKGITLMGCWYNEHDKQYENTDSVIYCINNTTHPIEEKKFLSKINEAIHTGIWFNTDNTNLYFGGRVDKLCAFQ